MNDLMGIIALPSIWSGRTQEHVISTLLGGVCRVLDLDFVYARLNTPGARRIELLQIVNTESTRIDRDGLHQALRQWLRNDPEMRSSVLAAPLQDYQFGLASFGLGADQRTGVFVAGSVRFGFPSKAERLLLNVASNEASVALREAQLLNEQRRFAKGLDIQAARHDEELKRINNGSQAATVDEARKSVVAELRARYAHLTPREREVLPFVVAGWLSKQTAAELGASEITIRVHRGQIMRKMQAQSLAELIRMADVLKIRQLPGSGNTPAFDIDGV